MLIGNKWAFAHIPKCGGMAVRSVLTGTEEGAMLPLGKKAPIFSPLHRITETRPVGRQRTFTIIRHPAAWIKSFWQDQTPERVGDLPSEKKRYLHRFWSDDLNQFAMNLCAHHPGYVGSLYRAYTRPFRMAVFRLEDGIEQAIERGIGIWYSIPVVNASVQSAQYDPEVYQMILTAEASCLRRYRYI